MKIFLAHVSNAVTVGNTCVSLFSFRFILFDSWINWAKLRLDEQNFHKQIVIVGHAASRWRKGKRQSSTA